MEGHEFLVAKKVERAGRGMGECTGQDRSSVDDPDILEDLKKGELEAKGMGEGNIPETSGSAGVDKCLGLNVVYGTWDNDVVAVRDLGGANWHRGSYLTCSKEGWDSGEFQCLVYMGDSMADDDLARKKGYS